MIICWEHMAAAAEQALFLVLALLVREFVSGLVDRPHIHALVADQSMYNPDSMCESQIEDIVNEGIAEMACPSQAMDCCFL